MSIKTRANYTCILFIKEVSCAECEDWMGRISDLMATDEFANKVYSDLSGPVFCDDPAYVPAESVEECKGLI